MSNDTITFIPSITISSFEMEAFKAATSYSSFRKVIEAVEVHGTDVPEATYKLALLLEMADAASQRSAAARNWKQHSAAERDVSRYFSSFWEKVDSYVD